MERRCGGLERRVEIDHRAEARPLLFLGWLLREAFSGAGIFRDRREVLSGRHLLVREGLGYLGGLSGERLVERRLLLRWVRRRWRHEDISEETDLRLLLLLGLREALLPALLGFLLRPRQRRRLRCGCLTRHSAP